MNCLISSTVVLVAFAAFASAGDEGKPPKITKANLIEMEGLVERGADPNAPIGFSRMRRTDETEPPTSPKPRSIDVRK